MTLHYVNVTSVGALKSNKLVLIITQ